MDNKLGKRRDQLTRDFESIAGGLNWEERLALARTLSHLTRRLVISALIMKVDEDSVQLPFLPHVDPFPKPTHREVL